jgi:hypothetical protein
MFRPTFAPSCTIYVDETGSFKDKGNTYNGLCAVVYRNDPIIQASVKSTVESIESAVSPSERLERTGEIKSFLLSPERLRAVGQLFQTHQIVVCHRAFRILKTGDLGEFGVLIPDVERQLREAEKVSSRYGDEVNVISKAFAKASKEDRYYAFAMGYFFQRIVTQLFNGIPLPEVIEIVFDPRLNYRYEPMLPFLVKLAFTSQFKEYVTGTLPSVFSNEVYPWRIRKPNLEDAPGLALADWLAFPFTLLLREDAEDEWKARYKEVPSLFLNRLFILPKDSPASPSKSFISNRKPPTSR